VSLQSAFDAAAAEYDRTRRQLIPAFDLFYRTATEVVASHLRPDCRFLDLGAGTGLLSAFLLEALPEARATLADLSEPMLAQARGRLAAKLVQCSFLVADYTAGLPDGPFDAIVSGLSIHHLEDTAKQNLFARIFAALRPGGVFVNADQVVGETPAIAQRCRDEWMQAVRASGISPEALAAAQSRLQFDRMSPLASQLDWLRAAGFEQVTCWFQHYSFVVYSGQKPRASDSPRAAAGTPALGILTR
jgi:tRNA (cmo5U34)-methyltransferase